MVGYRHLGRAGRLAAWFLVFGVSALFQAPAHADDQGWSIDPDARIEFGLISAESATRDEQIVLNGDAIVVRGQVAVDFEDDNTRFRLEADRIEAFRLGEGRNDTSRDRFTATFQQELGEDWVFELRARHYDDLITVESNNTDELQGSVALTYEPVRAHRLRVRGSWREREYDNGTEPETRGDGPRFDAEYRYRFGRYHYLTFDLRSEFIRSDDPDRGFSRQSARASYTRPITPDLRVRPAIEILQTEFDLRMTDDGSQREDVLVAPEVELLWWPNRWRIEAEARYIFSSSNQPTREREGYRLTLSIGYVF